MESKNAKQPTAVANQQLLEWQTRNLTMVSSTKNCAEKNHSQYSELSWRTLGLCGMFSLTLASSFTLSAAIGKIVPELLRRCRALKLSLNSSSNLSDGFFSWPFDKSSVLKVVFFFKIPPPLPFFDFMLLILKACCCCVQAVSR